MSTILVVDDERAVREGFKELLESEGYTVLTANGGDAALDQLKKECIDLVLLDVMMPRKNGFCVCQEIRKHDALLPVIFLTAKIGEADQLRGLGLGADDYLDKGVAEQVLVARIRRALERVALCRASRQPPLTNLRQIGVYAFSPRDLQIRDGERVVANLTRTEAGLLEMFLNDEGGWFSPDKIITCLRGQGFACTDSMVYVHVFNLRQKLGPDGECIECSRGIGYRFRHK